MGDVRGLIRGHAEEAKEVPDRFVEVSDFEPAMQPTAEEADHCAPNDRFRHLTVRDREAATLDPALEVARPTLPDGFVQALVRKPRAEDEPGAERILRDTP